MDITEMVSGDGTDAWNKKAHEWPSLRPPDRSFWILLVSFGFCVVATLVVKSLHLFGVAKVYNTYHWMSSWPQERCAKFDTFHKSVFSSRRLPSSSIAHFLSRSWTRSR